MPAPKIIGECSCGRYRFTIPKPDEMNLCHCMDCRKWSGSFHSAHLLVQKADIEMTGPPPRTRTVPGASGAEMTRAWCDACGSGLWIASSDAPGGRNLKAGLFKQGEVPAPTTENWLKNKEEWESLQEVTKKYQENFDD